MTDAHDERERCRLCGAPRSGGPAGTGSTAPFCSTGCRDVDDALGPVEREPEPARGDADTGGAAGARQSERVDQGDEGTVRTFFRVDGMHSALCESYLESIAEERDGVVDVAASYVTETVRVDHDPERVSATDLRDALSGVGYTAYRREEAADGDGGTRRSREMTGLRKRRADDMLEARYVVGIVFGSFLLVPFVAVFYPVYLAEFLDWGFLAHYEDAFTDLDWRLLLPAFFGLTGAVLYLAGMPLLRGAYVGLTLRRANTHLLAALTIVGAYAYGTLALVLGRNDLYYDLAILVAAVVMAAVFYEATVKRRALDRLTDLTVSEVDEARRLEADGTTTELAVADLDAGDRVLVRQGERIPVDGTLVESECTVDEAVVTGESLPVSKAPGDEVIGGSVVTAGAAVVAAGDRTTSSIRRLTESVWDLQSATHGAQRRADRLAAVLLPPVVVAAVVVGAARLALGGSATDAAMALLLTVIVASPWGLALSTPVSVASSVRDAMVRGVVVFDETVFERLRAVDVVVFDKTGTLTTGEMRVLEADAPDDLLRAVGALEARASHPVATAIAAAYGPGDEPVRSDGGSVDGVRDGDESAAAVEEFRTHATGVEGTVDDTRVLVGHPDLFEARDWTLADSLASRAADARSQGSIPVVVGRDGRAEGLLVVGDEPRDDWAETASSLAESGIEVVVLTGDDAAASDFLADHPAVARVFAAVPPAGKTAAIRRLAATNRVAMVGDGTNDAPALAAADLGISLGGGTALAADAADLAILEDELAAVERAFALAAAAGDRVRRNRRLALVYNAIAIPVALAGLLNPLFAVAAVAASALLVVANSSRPLLDAASTE